MNIINVLGNFDNSKLNIIQDVVKKNCIKSIWISYFNGFEQHFTGKVKFENLGTTLEQEFTGKSLMDVYMQIAYFCMSLPD